ncbi:SpaH/EbpB family LPXTG-anchored major pilin [Corynebacterium sp.]|uniref:SpaH/EbpB family LPXTG-anchored major pilin n=1 Tax=Corynebacterium sp. TaxID=1720 RepID=UPI0026DBDD5C|nr:SpaH/EbpB family LPXTG-anchored major pilin [Corynebacterium sp.]MDO5032437.1 SpaH/EbpB family LPXTG-anchored major pilin [Corynebacterium sp.]
MKKVSRTARSVSFAAIVGLSTALAAPGIAAAEQVSVLAQEAPAQNVASGNIDFTKTGSITIHKRIGAEDGTNHSGNQLNDEPGNDVTEEDLKSIKFEVTQVEADLTTNEGFAKAKALTPETAKPFGDTKELTSTNGVFTATDLPIGVYLVEEVVTDNTSLVPGKPFLVFVPTTNNDEDQSAQNGEGQKSNWNYDVHVYPKNSKVQVTKEVDDANQNAGDSITYTVTGQAPHFDDSKKLTKFYFEDQLDPRVSFDEATANIEAKTAEGLVLDDADYTVTATGASATVGTKLTVELTRSGLDKVKSGETLSLIFDVEVLPVGEDAGDITNEATIITNNPNGGNDIENKTNKVYTYHGKVKVQKVDANSDNGEGKKPLSGAKFALFQSEDDKCEAGVDDKEENRVTIKGQNEFVTDKNGVFTIDGLHVNNVFNDNNTGDVPQDLAYCLKEIEAPAGYALSDKLHQFTLTVTEARGDDPLNNQPIISLASASTPLKNGALEIENVRQETPNLPLTGGAGVGILAAIGALIIGAGAFFARRSAKN